MTFEETEEALARLIGSRVSVRIVERTEPERLVAVYEGVLCAPSAEKAPSRFWPLDDGLGPREGGAERFGLVLHREAFGGAEVRVDDEILIVTQGAVLVNVRRL